MARARQLTDAQVAALLPAADSVACRLADDARSLLGAGYALVLQVAHPVVGAGVAEHSDYHSDPWGRLLRTLDFTTSLLHAPAPQAALQARTLRARHRHIRGRRADGASYSALQPDAFAWVWATLFAAIIGAHARFGTRPARDVRARCWGEWRRLGRVLGVEPSALPASLAGFEDYFEDMIQDVLEDNDSVRGVLASIARPADPPLPAAARPLWALARVPASHTLRLATVALLPPLLRERLGLRLGLAEEIEVRALSAACIASGPLLPPPLRGFGPAYTRARAARRDPEEERPAA